MFILHNKYSTADLNIVKDVLEDLLLGDAEVRVVVIWM